MELFKKNPFLAGLGAAAALVLLLGGYLVFAQAARLAEEETTYGDKKTTLARLKANKPFPDQNNVAAVQDETKQAAALLEAMAQGFQVQAPALSPQAFQDELTKLVRDISDKAAQKGVSLPEDFYLGFETYETQPPPAAAAAQLGLQLRAIHAVADALVGAQVKSLGAISRAPLPGEAPQEDGESEPEEKKAKKQKEEATPSFAMAPFDINFTADQSAFRDAFNRILDVSPPLFVRLIAIANSSPTAPPKVDPAAAEPEPEATEKQTAGIKAVLGRETLTVDLRLASIAGGSTTP